ncbi:MAG: hypothetical protein ACRCTD_11580 [Beijerinckiaceae bacterium]
MQRYGTLIVAILAIGIYAGSGWLFPRKPLPPEAFKRNLPAKTAENKPALTVHTIDLPGPDGKRITATFYGLERLPAAGDDLCKQLHQRRAAIGPLPESPDNPEKNVWVDATLKRACDDMVDEEGEPIKPVQRGGMAAHAAASLASIDNKPIMDAAFAASWAHWMLGELRKAKNVGDVQQAIEGSHSLDKAADAPNNIIFKRLSADIDRLRAELCEEVEGSHCRARFLSTAGRDYARLGRLEDNEQHFRDMIIVLNEAEQLVGKINQKAIRTDLLDDIAAAFGYAGEAGRDRNMLVRATDISRRIVRELETEKDGDDKWNYSNAIESLASNLGRVAVGASNRIAVTREAVEAGEMAIAHSKRHFPDDISWAAQINLATSQRELYELTSEDDVLDKSIDNARQSLATLASRIQEKKTVRDYNVAYSQCALAYSLAARAYYTHSLGNDDRAALQDEARKLLDQAEPVFRAINAQAYLRMIARARALLPQEE